MARFPKSEPEVAALAMLVSEGLAQAQEDSPMPPVPPDELRSKLGGPRKRIGFGFDSRRAVYGDSANTRGGALGFGVEPAKCALSAVGVGVGVAIVTYLGVRKLTSA